MWRQCRYFCCITLLAFAVVFAAGTSAELPANPRSEDDGQHDVADTLEILGVALLARPDLAHDPRKPPGALSRLARSIPDRGVAGSMVNVGRPASVSEQKSGFSEATRGQNLGQTPPV